MNQLQSMLIFINLVSLAFLQLASAQNPETVPAASSWPENDLSAIRKQLDLAINSYPSAAKQFSNLNWGQSKNLHRHLIRCLQEIPEVDRVLLQTRNRMPLPQIKIEGITGNAHVQLEIAMILVKTNRHDEALSLIEKLDKKSLVEPGLALLYQTICLHRKVEVKDALEIANVLMANRNQLPDRYSTLAESLYNDLMKHENAPLHTVARLMADAGRRQEQQEQSDQALKQEEEIIKKLDEAIKDLEKQQQQVASSSESQRQPPPSNGKSRQAETAPQKTGRQATGDVTSKNEKSASDWGNITEEEKAIAVRSLVRGLPPHFQSLLKAYFQKLAEEKK